MRLLFVIFVLCVAALVWTAIGIARHIRRHQADASPQNLTSAEDELEIGAAVDAEELVPTGPPRQS